LGGHRGCDGAVLASTVVSQVEKMNVSPTVNGRFVSGSVLTNVARIHDSSTPTTGVIARIILLDRSDETLIHSLRSVVGSEPTSSRRVRDVARAGWRVCWSPSLVDDWTMAEASVMVML
jgi:hypothetical protein